MSKMNCESRSDAVSLIPDEPNVNAVTDTFHHVFNFMQVLFYAPHKNVVSFIGALREELTVKRFYLGKQHCGVIE